MSLAEYYRTCALPKSNQAVDKLQRERAASAAERICRAKVNDRDGYQCFWPTCKKRADHRHHIVLRSQGGAWISKNILSACKTHHDYFHAGFVRVSGNPDRRGSIKVHLTELGKAAKIRLQAA